MECLLFLWARWDRTTWGWPQLWGYWDRFQCWFLSFPEAFIGSRCGLPIKGVILLKLTHKRMASLSPAASPMLPFFPLPVCFSTLSSLAMIVSSCCLYSTLKNAINIFQLSFSPAWGCQSNKSKVECIPLFLGVMYLQQLVIKCNNSLLSRLVVKRASHIK